MTREHALRKLLEHGALSEPEAFVTCGWPRDELAALLKKLVRSKVVTTAVDGVRHVRVYRLRA